MRTRTSFRFDAKERYGIVLPVLMLVAVAVGAYITREFERRVWFPAEAPGFQAAIQQLDERIDGIRAKLVEAPDVVLVRPPPSVAPVVVEKVQTVDLRVTGIVLSEDEPLASLAFINGRVVGLGGEVAGRRVVRIGESSVVVTNGAGVETTLPLYPNRGP
jgi:hypothetical protein